jgi:hypothetical protein
MDYPRIYNQLVSKRKTELLEKTTELYTENHHIVPRCMGGLDEESNMVRLTAKEHFIAHMLLAKIHRTRGLLYVIFLMSSSDTYGSRQHAWIKEALFGEDTKYCSKETIDAFKQDAYEVIKSHFDGVPVIFQKIKSVEPVLCRTSFFDDVRTVLLSRGFTYMERTVIDDDDITEDMVNSNVEYFQTKNYEVYTDVSDKPTCAGTETKYKKPKVSQPKKLSGNDKLWNSLNSHINGMYNQNYY